MKKCIQLIFGLLAINMLICFPAYAGNLTNAAMIQELKAMQAKIQELEARLATAEQRADVGVQRTPTKTGGVKSLETRLQKLEDAVTRPVAGGNWFDRFQIGGLIEFEAGYEKVSNNDPATEDETSSDADLAAAELVVDAKLSEHVDGHVLLKYEDDDVFVDEGFITVTGPEQIPVYLMGGRMYIPFGNYDSHFVSDPNTLVLGETNEGAVVVGYRFGGDMVDVSAGVFKGRVLELDSDDEIDSFVAAVTFNPMEMLSLGVSYVSNIASSDNLSEFVTSEDGIESQLGGVAAFASVTLLDRITLIGEYVMATEAFAAGELFSEDETLQREPKAWNLELGVGITDTIEAALRYGGSEDGGDMMSENQYGAVVNFGIYDCNLALEYMHSEFEDDIQEVDTFTAQFALEF